jgi:ribonuclease Z
MFFSHLHGDHLYGLMGLLSTMGLNGRVNTLKIFGPEGIKNFVQCSLNSTAQFLPFEIHFTEIPMDYAGYLIQTENYNVHCFPVKHSVTCFGYVFEGQVKRRRINKDYVESLKIPQADVAKIAEGSGWVAPNGTIHEYETLVLPPVKPHKYVFITDTVPLPEYPEITFGANLLYHEATFLHASLRP